MSNPTRTFADGEATRVTLDPADQPAIFVMADGPASVECAIRAPSGTAPSLTRYDGAIDLTVNDWELRYRLIRPSDARARRRGAP